MYICVYIYICICICIYVYLYLSRHHRCPRDLVPAAPLSSEYDTCRIGNVRFHRAKPFAANVEYTPAAIKNGQGRVRLALVVTGGGV